MTHLTLPVVKTTDSLRKALDLMRAMRVSGAVCQARDKNWLLEAGDAVVELSNNPNALVRAAFPKQQNREADVIEVVDLKDIRAMLPTDLLTDLTGAVSGYRTSSEGTVATIAVLSKNLEKALLSSPFDCFCSKNRERITGCKNGAACPNKDGGRVCCV
jgi:hypothetical protein